MVYFLQCSMIILVILISSGNMAKVPKLTRSRSSATDGIVDSQDRSNDPYDQFAQFLIQSAAEGDELENYSADEVRRTVKKLAAGQATLKTMDGAAHQLTSSFSESSSSLSARFEKFMAGEKKKLKEAGKLYEYVTTIERSLQAAEILQAVSQRKGKERGRRMKAAGLRELKRFKICNNGLRCVVSVMQSISEGSLDESSGSEEVVEGEEVRGADTRHSSSSSSSSSRKVGGQKQKNTSPKGSTSRNIEVQRFSPGELVVGVVDDCSRSDEGHASSSAVKQLLNILTQDPACLPLSSVGLVEEEVTVQPTLLAIAAEALSGLVDFILPLPPVVEVESDPETSEDPVKGAGKGASTGSVSDLDSQSISSASVRSNIDEDAVGDSGLPLDQSGQDQGRGGEEGRALTVGGRPVPSKISVVGHSAGGAVGAYVAMVLEGFLNSTDPRLGGTESLVGTYAGRVTCTCLGPPPCVSRAVVPRFISTIICGDDAVPRGSPQSLSHAKERVVKALKAGAGDKMGLRWKVGSGWLSDLQSVAGKGLEQYSGGSHDLSALSVPGRAFYLKSRKHRQGASLQRVLRGQWREDILWMLHEILFSNRMMDHHSLEEHIRTLARC